MLQWIGGERSGANSYELILWEDLTTLLPTPTPEPVQRNHLLILSPDRSQLLVEIRANLGYLLPAVSTEIGRRVLPVLQEHLTQLGVPVESIVSLWSRNSKPEGILDALHLVETPSPVDSIGTHLEWSSIQELLQTCALWDIQGSFLREYSAVAPSLLARSSGRFIGYHGWMADLRDWTNAAARNAELGTIESFVPFRVSRVKAVVFFRTNTGARIYVKCFAPAPFTEALMTRALNERYPDAIAETIAFSKDRGWWAAKEVRGASLVEHLTLENCLHAIERFTMIQKDLAGSGAAFARTGLRHLRLGEIEQDLDSTIRELTQLAVFSAGGLAEMRSRFLRAVEILKELDFPSSLIHSDLTPWNVVLSNQGAAFLDWEDATWGPAFVSLEIFLAALRSPQRRLGESGWIERIRDCYLAAWGENEAQCKDPRATHGSRALALYCKLQAFLRCWRDEPNVHCGRRNVVQITLKLDRILRYPR